MIFSASVHCISIKKDVEGRANGYNEVGRAQGASHGNVKMLPGL